MDIADYYYDEMKGLGLQVVEVSDNYLDLTLESKCRLIECGSQKHGLRILAEAGDELEETPLETLINDCNSCKQAGAWKVLLEAAELMDKQTGELKMHYLDAISGSVGLENIIFELPWVWLANVHWHQTFSSLSTMVGKLGPQVNLGNIEISMLVYCQMIRNGAGTKLAKDRQV
jgi:phosphosulfolactate synthase (CoM biosynthesis protein A)